MSLITPIPHLSVNDGTAAVAFYEKAFGAITENKVPAKDGKRLLHAHLKIGNGVLLLHDDFPEMQANTAGGTKPPTRLGGTSVTIHLEVPDADAAFDRALKAGATVVVPLANQFWDMRYGQVQDPFGHIWAIGGPVKT